MSKPIITEFNSSTGETIEREMTDYEYEQVTILEAKNAEREELALAAQAAREAILDRLGITAEEANLLLG
jgi:hypothetical protein